MLGFGRYALLKTVLLVASPTGSPSGSLARARGQGKMGEQACQLTQTAFRILAAPREGSRGCSSKSAYGPPRPPFHPEWHRTIKSRQPTKSLGLLLLVSLRGTKHLCGGGVEAGRPSASREVCGDRYSAALHRGALVATGAPISGLTYLHLHSRFTRPTL